MQCGSLMTRSFTSPVARRLVFTSTLLRLYNACSCAIYDSSIFDPWLLLNERSCDILPNIMYVQTVPARGRSEKLESARRRNLPQTRLDLVCPIEHDESQRVF